MPVTFPAIRPTDRRLVPGTVPQSVTRAVNGRTVRRPLASSQGGMRLEVEFTNRPDSEVEAIRQVRNAAKADPVLLPDELFAGDPELLVFVKFLPPDAAWRFSGDVEVEWAKRGRATVRVAFVNYRRTVLALPPPPEIEVPPPPPLQYRLRLSETITPNIIQSNDGKAIFTKAGSIYWAGTTSVNGTNKYVLMKYDYEGNWLWGRVLEGVYVPRGQPNQSFSAPCLCEGLTDGAFVAATGPPLASAGDLGACHRIWQFTGDGQLSLYKAWAFRYYGYPVESYYKDKPLEIYCEQSQNKLYILGAQHSMTVLNALTLDAPYATTPDIGGLNAPIGRPFWLPLKNRVLGVYADGAGGVRLREYSPDLQTVYQSYTYTIPYAGFFAQYPAVGFAVDAFGAVYIASAVPNLNASLPGTASLAKLSASDGGYAPVWVRTWATPAFGDARTFPYQGVRVSVMPDGTFIVTTKEGGGKDYQKAGLIHSFTLTADATKITRRTTINWANNNGSNAAAGGDYIDPVKQLFVFTTPRLGLGISSFSLPAAQFSIPISSSVNTSDPSLTMTGQSFFQEVATTAGALPTKTVWAPTPITGMNPMVLFDDGVWTASDLAAINAQTLRDSGPLTVP